ncbi:MAG: hypothetical protein M3N53_12045 [Actinomycetota bacterium]|nr:hypothetical protein [Actinomycetota bacterium]
MTALIGGSLLLIAGSAIVLVIGWTSANESLIWTSIAASVGAAIMLSLGYYRSKAEAARGPAPQRRPRPESPRAPAAPAAAPAAQPTQPVPLVPRGDDGDRVIAYADRSRFHRPDCRYASIPGGEEISRQAAQRRGYDPCGVCKP